MLVFVSRFRLPPFNQLMAIRTIKSDKMWVVFDRLAIEIYLAAIGRGDDRVAELARFQTVSAKYFFDEKFAHKN
jgi:hypothetical protein